jgi:hypothetical protein
MATVYRGRMTGETAYSRDINSGVDCKAQEMIVLIIFKKYA